MSHAPLLLEFAELATASGAIERCILLVKVFQVLLDIELLHDHDQVILQLRVKSVMEVDVVLGGLVSIEDLCHLG